MTRTGPKITWEQVWNRNSMHKQLSGRTRKFVMFMPGTGLWPELTILASFHKHRNCLRASLLSKNGRPPRDLAISMNIENDGPSGGPLSTRRRILKIAIGSAGAAWNVCVEYGVSVPFTTRLGSRQQLMPLME